MITGVDEISLKVIKDFNQGQTISYVVARYEISLDQAKKLSRLNSIYEQLKELPELLQVKLRGLGVKLLVLAPLVKDKDIEGIIDILQSVESDVKRDTLVKMIPALKEKRKHIKEAQREIDYKMNSLKYTEKQIESRIVQLNEVKGKIDEIFSFLSGASLEAKNFLTEHLGVKEDKIVLSKRLYYTWQQELKREGTITYNDYSYSWEVTNIDKLITSTERKLKNKRSIKCMYFDPEADPWNSSPEYKKVQGLNISLNELVKENEVELKKLNKEKKVILKSIDNIKSKSAMSYMEAAVLSNQLSAKDIETHALLQNSGMKWLYERNNVCCTEFTQGNYRFDVIGYDSNNVVTIIEAKASVEDFRRDTKWQNYMKYCNKFYFIFHEDEFYYFKKELQELIESYGAGILIVKNNKIEIFNESTFRDIEEERSKLIFNIARICSKKMIFGY